MSVSHLHKNYSLQIQLHVVRVTLQQTAELKLEEASTHKSAQVHTSNVFVTRDLDLWPQNKCVSRTHLGTFLCHVWWS